RTKPGVTPARSASSFSVSDSFTTGHHRKVGSVLVSTGSWCGSLRAKLRSVLDIGATILTKHVQSWEDPAWQPKGEPCGLCRPSYWSPCQPRARRLERPRNPQRPKTCRRSSGCATDGCRYLRAGSLTSRGYETAARSSLRPIPQHRMGSIRGSGCTTTRV